MWQGWKKTEITVILRCKVIRDPSEWKTEHQELQRQAGLQWAGNAPQEQVALDCRNCGDLHGEWGLGNQRHGAEDQQEAHGLGDTQPDQF